METYCFHLTSESDPNVAAKGYVVNIKTGKRLFDGIEVSCTKDSKMMKFPKGRHQYRFQVTGKGQFTIALKREVQDTVVIVQPKPLSTETTTEKRYSFKII